MSWRAVFYLRPVKAGLRLLLTAAGIVLRVAVVERGMLSILRCDADRAILKDRYLLLDKFEVRQEKP